MEQTNEYRLESEPTRYGQRIQLPDRDFGEASVFGWALVAFGAVGVLFMLCLLYTSPSPRDLSTSRMPSSA